MAESLRTPKAKPWEVPDGLWERIVPLFRSTSAAIATRAD